MPPRSGKLSSARCHDRAVENDQEGVMRISALAGKPASGTENINKIYAESMVDPSHLDAIAARRVPSSTVPWDPAHDLPGRARSSVSAGIPRFGCAAAYHVAALSLRHRRSRTGCVRMGGPPYLRSSATTLDFAAAAVSDAAASGRASGGVEDFKLPTGWKQCASESFTRRSTRSNRSPRRVVRPM